MLSSLRQRGALPSVPLRHLPLLGATAAVIFVLVLVLQSDGVTTSPSPSFESAAGSFKLNRGRVDDFHLGATKDKPLSKSTGRQACGDSKPMPEMCNEDGNAGRGGVGRWMAQLGAGSSRERIDRACRWDNQREGYFCAPIGGEGDR